MEEALKTAFEILANHGYVVIAAWMFADQAALPLPSIPLLVAAGVVAASGELDLGLVIVVASVATILADALWFLIGKRGGARAIGLICRLSLEPDSCVTTTRNAFGRFGPMTLVIAKFLPGVQTLAPASAGFAQASWLGFLALDLIGTLLFILPFTLGGYFFQAQILEVVAALGEIGGMLTLAVVFILGMYAAVKLVQWLAFFRGHRLRRLTPEELRSRFEEDLGTTVIDLRQRFDYELEPRIIPGALRIPISEIPKRHPEIPGEHDIVLVCT